MWTTLDGYRLRLPRSGNVLITAQSPGTGRRASLRRPDGSLDRSSVRFIGRVAGSSTRIGALRDTGSNRRCPVFTAELNGRHYQTVTRPSAASGELVILAVRPEVRRFSGELSDGIGHRTAQNRIYNWLRRQGLQDSQVLERTNPAAFGDGIRDNRHQVVGLSGPTRPNEPDISYPGFIGPGDLRRVNVEIDTDPDRQRDHIRTLIANDQRSMHIFRLVDPLTGRTLRTQVWDPRTQAFVPNARPNRRLPRPGTLQGNLPLRAPRAAMPPPPPTPPPIPPRFRTPQQSLFPPTPGRPRREFEREGFF